MHYVLRSHNHQPYDATRELTVGLLLAVVVGVGGFVRAYATHGEVWCELTACLTHRELGKAY